MRTGATRRETEEQAETVFCGHSIVLDPSGAAFFPELFLLVVSDLHLERGAAHARRGSLLPPYDTSLVLSRLAAVIGRYQPQRVVSLGDSFHDRRGSAEMPDHFRQTLGALIAGRDWIWINGNHDPDGVAGLAGLALDQWSFAGLSFRHEPGPGIAEICGHLHPSATLRRRDKNVRRPCFAIDEKRLMLPAFGTLSGGLDLKHRAFAGLFERQQLMVHLLGSDRVYTLPFNRLSG
ncbi:ligase-associated DNA damage response endonuclease PdeM [Martelella alba]|uniref:Ligase-associated DNA damage response endonuclease PdeM n=1 Tax=Martelella alba TaxID=2590451 RepID=A0A506UC43_9HYPH|nr:ligase-associated DNA damage response endonuclease PdeM [Martelella alba]TPW30976.1 ligase-associated DNA damage response endonuclease PdeM [Martelella alba]